MRYQGLRFLLPFLSVLILYIFSVSTVQARVRIFTDRQAFKAASQNLVATDFEDQPLQRSSSITVNGITFQSVLAFVQINIRNASKVVIGETAGEGTSLNILPPSGTTAIGFEQLTGRMDVTIFGIGEYHYPQSSSTFLGIVSSVPIQGMQFRFSCSGCSPDMIFDDFLVGQAKPEPPLPAAFDFDGDLKADVSIWRPSNGIWYVINSANSLTDFYGWGTMGDIAVPGDYDGDGKADRAVWRPSNGVWYIVESSTSVSRTRAWGVAGDVPVPGDYDFDGKTDIAIFRESASKWYIVRSLDGTQQELSWGGQPGSLPVPGNYNGDERSELALWEPATGRWHIRNILLGTTVDQFWGIANDKPVPGDYDGDGLTDLAVWRPSSGIWYILNSANQSVTVKSWGSNGDVPVPADYDGDGKTDIGIWRPSNGTWYIINSSDNSVRVVGWGVSGDVAVPSAYIR